MWTCVAHALLRWSPCRDTTDCHAPCVAFGGCLIPGNCCGVIMSGSVLNVASLLQFVLVLGMWLWR
jgi:hypothetical protein